MEKENSVYMGKYMESDEFVYILSGEKEELMKQSNQEQVRAERNRQRDAEQNRKLISELKQSVELLKNSNELLQDAISGGLCM